MKTEVIKNEDGPCVGEPWRYTKGKRVYLRIDDTQGEKAVGKIQNSFYSVDLTTGEIVPTSWSESIELLRPAYDALQFLIA